MNYDSQKPIATFLGPSLARFQATQLLRANYYPPAQMGDIYQLLGSGVQIILLIDGVFHTVASVWQRELLEALDNNIRVIGASSMGALRAAELHTFGMIGQGTIFEWYRDGVIEGDDEVALNHTDEAHGFRPFSEPLVNIRYNLRQAVRHNYISQSQAAELIALAKRTYYAERSYELLLNSELVKEWPRRVQDQLRQFIRQQGVNLKRQDAVAALRYCARVARSGDSGATTPTSTRHQGRYYRLASYRHRGFYHPDGYLVQGEALLAAALQDPALTERLRPVLIKNYFLRQWAKHRHINCPTDYLEAYRRTWKQKYIEVDKDRWLRTNGLTELELQTALTDRALLTWLVEQGPAHFGLDFQPYEQFVAVSLFLDSAQETGTTLLGPRSTQTGTEGNKSFGSYILTRDFLRSQTSPLGTSGGDLSIFCEHKIATTTTERLRPESTRLTNLLGQAAEICYLAAWARENGIVCPSAEVETFIQKWEATYQIQQRGTWLKAMHMPEVTYLSVLAAWASYNWLIEKGPSYFGYTSWSFEVVLLKELQITGQAGRIVEKMGLYGFEG